MKIDTKNNKELYFKWKESTINGISNISEENSKLIIRYVTDMEKGFNVAVGSKKGSRSYSRLNTLRKQVESIDKC